VKISEYRFKVQHHLSLLSTFLIYLLFPFALVFDVLPQDSRFLERIERLISAIFQALSSATALRSQSFLEILAAFAFSQPQPDASLLVIAYKMHDGPARSDILDAGSEPHSRHQRQFELLRPLLEADVYGQMSL
jgi:hypothetical protein